VEALRPVVSEVASDVFHVEGPGTNWQLLVEGDAVTLVDAAWPRDAALVTGSLARIGRRPEDVAVILLTHAHRDHLGTAAELRHRYGMPVRTHVAEAAHARGEVIEEISKRTLVSKLWRPTVMLFVANVVWHGGARATRVADVETFDEGAPLDVPGRPIPVATPGHTSGHCSFHLPDQGVVIAGDAFATFDLLRRRPMLGPMPREFDVDPDRSLQSLVRLATLDAQVVLPGHGPPFRGSPAEAVERATSTGGRS
jgi:glyoxylase-like metal-dependent hydrolase (beta-lactamase superfamily II)